MNYEKKYKEALDRAMNLFVTNNISATAVCKIFPELNESEEMNYEKKYKKALEWMQSLYSGLHGATKEDAEHYFPELKESEDERIRNFLIDFIKVCTWTEKKDQGWPSREDCLAWLEKQGENKPTDEVELKFHEGDWIVGNEGIFKITHYEDEYGYELTDTTGCVVHFVSPDYVESNFHLWTIEDAKDGDVLCCESGWTCIFKTLVNDENYSSYCFMDSTKWFCEEGSECHTINKEFEKAYNGEIKPATKKQCDQLFQKMKEEGYEWDADKKELKKIEPKKLDADKVIAWLVANICHFDYYVKLFKKDFGLTEKGGEE